MVSRASPVGVVQRRSWASEPEEVWIWADGLPLEVKRRWKCEGRREEVMEAVLERRSQLML